MPYTGLLYKLCFKIHHDQLWKHSINEWRIIKWAEMCHISPANGPFTGENAIFWRFHHSCGLVITPIFHFRTNGFFRVLPFCSSNRNSITLLWHLRMKISLWTINIIMLIFFYKFFNALNGKFPYFSLKSWCSRCTHMYCLSAMSVIKFECLNVWWNCTAAKLCYTKNLCTDVPCAVHNYS